MSAPGVVVVGSCNVDLTVTVPRLPAPGETVLGSDHLRVPGGKGANQAVAAARLGQQVELIARLGDDDLGAMLRRHLLAEGVGTTHLRTVETAPTGLALITVDADGENTIAVSPGANGALTGADVTDAADLLRTAAVTLLQLEVPDEAVLAAAAAAEGTLVLNPAPARPLPSALWHSVDVVVPNRTELAVLAGAAPPNDAAEVVALARRLPVPAVVVTLGADGALVVDGSDVLALPADAVDAVDTTGAGDAFCGGLADALARGATLADAAGWAVRVAGRATTARGAQAALPTRDEVTGRRRGAQR